MLTNIKDKTTLISPNALYHSNEEILNLKGKVKKGKAMLKEKCVKRYGMRAEMTQMKAKYEKSQIKLLNFNQRSLTWK